VVLTNLLHNRSPACHGFGTENNKNQVLFGRRHYIKAALAALFVRPHRVTVLCQETEIATTRCRTRHPAA
jgi:hypothetical protein